MFCTYCFVSSLYRHNSTAINVAMNSLNYYDADGISESFNQISWTNDTIRLFETAVRNAKHYQVCLFDVSDDESFSQYSSK